MRVRFLGAVDEVTGAAYLLEAAGHRVLLDFGLCQGKRKETFERNRNLPFDPRSIDFLILSHAHIDHSGNIPTLCRNGFQGPIFATPASADLCEAMLLDSAHIQERDVEYVNRKRARQGRHLFEPLYVQEDVRRCLPQFVQVAYEKSLEITPGINLIFLDAGHILGSAITRLDVRENGSGRRIVYTGDVGRPNTPILRDPVAPDRADAMLIESTYGNRLHPTDEDTRAVLANMVREIEERRSKAIIPAFSVGRTQTVVHYLHTLLEKGRIPAVPTYVDSPLSARVTEIFRRHKECFDEETLAFLESEDGNPFAFSNLRYTAEVEESKALNEAAGPMIIISASGMCESGRVLHHLAHAIEDERNIILIVGFQAVNTLGRRLVERERKVRIFGDPYEVRAEVLVLNGFSAHADADELLQYVGRMAKPPGRAFLVHGEPGQRDGFAQRLCRSGIESVSAPMPGEEVLL